ncbi:methyltransferase [Hydrogenophaga sp.]|uniref:methyltransferase n=1 Tax=Hydrogenophaga sp. TaxID=1904254 RepID=UPI00271E6D47|nr:methyltransferase [Hydrogenophaga sp.]MDO9134176.1 methyltransferase [Hydrogenophaga sp.]
MKQHLSLLASLEQISAILVLRSIFPWEVPMQESEDGIAAEERPDGARLLHDEAGNLLLTARMIGDDIELDIQNLLIEQPQAALSLMLQALGVHKAVYRLDAETLYDRVLSLDNAWVLLRNLKALPAEERIATAEKLIALGAEWHTLRMAQFEMRLKSSQKARIEALEQLVNDPEWLGDALGNVSLNGEPRGSAMTLQVQGRDYPSELAVVQLNWNVAQPLTAPVAAGKSASRKVLGVAVGASMLPRATRIDPKLIAVLQGASVTGHEVRIVERLTPALYKKAAEVLCELGGQWSTPKQAHVFASCPRDALAQVITTGELLTSKDYEFFPTPPELVQRLLLQTGLQAGMTVLEPQAGSGAIALAAAEVVGKDNVTCYELMPRNVERLRELGFELDGAVDFLQVTPEPRYQVICMNPPFSGGKDITHVEHAMKFLVPGGRLGAITSTTWRTANNAKSKAFRDWVSEHAIDVIEIERGAFKAAGTDVPTVMLVLQAPVVDDHEASCDNNTDTGCTSATDVMEELQAAFL